VKKQMQEDIRIVVTKSKRILVLALIMVLLVLVPGITSCGQKAATITIEESNSRVVKASVHVAAVGLGEILKNITDENQRIDVIRKFIDPIRFFNDKSGYFYVYYYNCVNVAHAIDKTLPGKDLTDYQDMKGLYVIQELSKTAKAGGGFVTFYWPHPQTKEEQRKIGYVEPIPGTDYFIGTGYYPDTQ
jgi:signal transduction histidine kinase